MNTIQFNIPTGMLAAVLDGRKTQLSLDLDAKVYDYHVGEILAVIEPYWVLRNKYGIIALLGNIDANIITINGYPCNICHGDPDKFPADLARNFVKITGIAVKKPCDFTDAEFEAEGIRANVSFCGGSEYDVTYYYMNRVGFDSEKEAFQFLLQAIYGEERGTELFHSEMLVIQFERCDREGNKV